MAKNFWEVEYKDFVPGVTFRFKKLNSLDVLDLADRNVGSTGKTKEFKRDCLVNVLWSKNGSDWRELMDEDGNLSLDIPSSALLDIFYKFRSEVCLPVFTESKTYQSLLNQDGQKEDK